MTIESQTDLGKHWGPLHIHSTTGVPRRAGLEHVHVVYADKGALPDRTAFAPIELYHSDVTFEIQPPGPTILRLITAPDCGGDTLFTSGAAVYASLSPFYQQYLDNLYAVHSGKEQSKGAQSAGQHIRRPAIENAHPVVRVNVSSMVQVPRIGNEPILTDGSPCVSARHRCQEHLREPWFHSTYPRSLQGRERQYSQLLVLAIRSNAGIHCPRQVGGQ
jgi:alpha-ketoglutarate-dependent taurine dioxygenase